MQIPLLTPSCNLGGQAVLPDTLRCRELGAEFFTLVINLTFETITVDVEK
jgi:hypothetical protein